MNKSFINFSIPLLLFSLLGFFIQKNIYLSGDVGYLLHATQQLLAGEKYADSIFETNPPMILYLYAPAYLLAKYSGISIIQAVRGYFFGLTWVIVISSFLLLKKIIKPADQFILYAFYYSLLFVLFILPVTQFGQREYLLILFLLPYLLSAVLRLEDKPLNGVAALLIGILAGMGIALKPFFLAPLILIESYFILKRRQLWSWVRVESLAIGVVLISYLGSIYIFQPDYLYQMLPLVSRLYFIGTAQPWVTIIFHPIVIFCLLVSVCYFYFRQNDSYSSLSTILLLAILGMIVAFLVPRTPWYYHLLPALSFAILLMSYYIATIAANVLSQPSSQLMKWRDSGILITISLFIFAIPLYFNLALLYFYLDEHQSGSRHKLINYIATLPGQHSVYCFSANTTEDCFPLIYYTHSEYHSRFPFFWWLRGVLKWEKYPQQTTLPSSILRDKNFLITKVAEEIARPETDLIIINTSDLAQVIDEKFKFADYFSQNKNFRTAWQHYRYLTSINHYQLYKRQR